MIDIKELILYSKNLKILYVEDDKNLLYEMSELFDNFFNNLVTATNGEEGLELYSKNKFDIIISDIKMPKMDGIEFSREVKKLNKEQEIVIISAYDDSDKLLSLIKIGISDFILKPMDFNQLLTVLYKVSQNVYNKKLEQTFIIQQQKMAMMGEMIDLIAHQWLQFVNVLGLKTEMLGIENKNNNLDFFKIEKYAKNSLNEIDELDKVLKEFREFFTDKIIEKIEIKKLIKSCLILVEDYLIKNFVEIELDLEDTKIEVYPNEFKQIIINIITNMVDNFNERDKKDRNIKIYFKDKILIIEDNGGGIDEQIKENIFDNNFTTKKKGSGKGLYLSKLIIEKINGEISVENTKYGVKFIVKVKK